MWRVAVRRFGHLAHASRGGSMAMDGLFERVCHRIDGIIGEDVGKRGISAIKLPDQLQEAAANFLDSRAVVVLTGFPCRLKDSPPTESDGPPGAIALAAAALRLGKPTAIATDECNTAVLAACAKAAGLEGLGSFELLSFPPKPLWTQAESDRLAAVAARYDHAVAIERAGRAADEGYYTMRAFSMVELVAPIDDLLTIDCACGVSDTAGVAATPVESDGEDDDDEEEEEEEAVRRRRALRVAPPFAVADGATGVVDGCHSDDPTGALPSLSEEGDTSFDDGAAEGAAAGTGTGAGDAPSTGGRQGFPRTSYAPTAGHVKNVVQRIEGRLQTTTAPSSAAPPVAAVAAPAALSPGGRPLVGRTEASRGPAAVAASGASAPLATGGASGHLAAAADARTDGAAAAGPASPSAGSATSQSTAVSSLAWAEIAGPTDLDATTASSSGSDTPHEVTGAATTGGDRSSSSAAPATIPAGTAASTSGAGISSSSSARSTSGAPGGSSGSPAGGVGRSTLSSSLSRGSIVPAPLINMRARGARGTLATGAGASSGAGGGSGAPTRHQSFMMPYRADVWSRAGSVAAPQSVMLRTSTGIGDGGNECGMGKVVDAVREHIPNGPTIACVVPADSLITAGVSNWGGWGLVAAVEALVRCRLAEASAAAGGATASVADGAAPATSSTLDATGAAATVSDTGSACPSLSPAAAAALFAGAPGCLLTSEAGERAIADAMIASGGRDGITGALDGSVDGMPLTTHLGILAQLRGVLADAFP